MTRLVFIHGINNEKNSAEKIADEWWQSIVDGWKEYGLQIKAKPQIKAAFYGDILAGGANGQSQQMGTSSEAAASASFEFLNEYRENAGLSDEEFARLQAAVDPGFNYQQQGSFRATLVRLAAAIAEGLPTISKVVTKSFLIQAVTYIEMAGIREAIHHKVIEQVFPNDGTPTIVVSHSLGTVVAYNTLFDAKYGVSEQGTPVPLLLTLGSPLAIDMMDAVTPARNSFPRPQVSKWINGFRKDDFVPLDKALKKATIGFDEIINYRTKMVDGKDPHSIAEYLKAEQISTALNDAL